MTNFKSQLVKIIEANLDWDSTLETPEEKLGKILTLIEQSLPKEKEKSPIMVISLQRKGYNKAISDVKSKLGADGE